MDTTTIAGQIATVTAHWHHHRLLAPATQQRVTNLLARFAKFATARGREDLAAVATSDCEAYVTTPTRRGPRPALATCYLRRTCLRTLFATAIELGLVQDNPAVGVHLPPREGRIVRPLNPDELALLRATALGVARQRDTAVATIALLEAGATTSEVPTITPANINLGSGTVTLPGAHPLRPRTIRLTAWAAHVLSPICQRTQPDASLTFLGSDPASHSAQASTVNRTRRLLRHAGLDEPSIRPSSIRLSIAAQELAEGGRIEQAAHRLGLSSLDKTADALGHDWLTP